MRQLLIILSVITLTFAGGGTGFSKKNNLGIKRFTGSVFLSGKGFAGLASFGKSFINPMNSAAWTYNPYTTFDFSIESSMAESSVAAGNSTVNSIALSSVNWVSHVIDTTLSIGFSLSPVLERHGEFLETQTSDITGSDVTFSNNYRGTVSEFKFGAAYRVNPKLSVSLDALYYFGGFEFETKFSENSGTPTWVNSNERLEESHYGLTVGINGLYEVSPTLFVAAQFTPSVTLTSNHKRIIQSEQDVDTYDINGNNALEMPTKFALGLGKTLPRFGKVYADYRFEDWASTGVTSNGVHLGYESFKSDDQFASLHERAAYFMGAFFYNEAFKFHFTDAAQADDVSTWGISAGALIPFNRGGNYLSIGVSYTKRGSISVNGVEDSVLNFNVGLSLNELWYQPESEDD